MIVKIKSYLYLPQALGWKDKTLDLPEGSTMAHLFRTLSSAGHFPERVKVGNSYLPLMEEGKLRNLNVFINGRHIKTLQGMETVLEEGASVTIFPPAAGG